jgi:hypothetical protein
LGSVFTGYLVESDQHHKCFPEISVLMLSFYQSTKWSLPRGFPTNTIHFLLLPSELHVCPIMPSFNYSNYAVNEYNTKFVIHLSLYRSLVHLFFLIRSKYCAYVFWQCLSVVCVCTPIRKPAIRLHTLPTARAQIHFNTFTHLSFHPGFFQVAPSPKEICCISL